MSDLAPGEKLCPYCAEIIKAAAIKCRYCGSELTGQETPPPGQPPDAPEVAAAPQLPEPAVAASAPTVASTSYDVHRPREESAQRQEEVLDRLMRSGQVTTGSSFLSSGTLSVVLGVLVAIFAVVLGVLVWRADNPAEGKAPNGVITSSEARTGGLAAATTLTQKALSYSYKSLDSDISSAKASMTPGFSKEYAAEMAKVRAQTLKNEVTLKATAVATSIISASEHQVKALVFVNQTTTVKGSRNQQVDQTRVVVTLKRGEGDWRVSKINAI